MGSCTEWAWGGYLLVVKKDRQGSHQWQRILSISIDTEIGNSIVETDDGGYAIAGIAEDYGGPGPFFCVFRIDGQGSLLWYWKYDNNYGSAESIQMTEDGGVIAVGNVYRSGFSSDVFLARLDNQGDSLWTRYYGGTGIEIPYAIRTTDDGGYIIAGKTNSYGAGAFDIYVIRTDSLGDTLWTRTYGERGNECAYEMQSTSDGGYIIAGDTDSHGAGQNDFYLVKIRSNGGTLWTRTYGGSGSDRAESVQQTDDGGYILAGSTDSFGSGSLDMYVVKTGPDPLLSAIEIQQPNGGEVLHLFSFDTVRWESNGSYVGPVSIELNHNYPLGTWETLATNLVNDGEAVVWIGGPVSDHCRVRIQTLDNALFYTADSSFAVTTTNGWLRLVYPSHPTSPLRQWFAGMVVPGDSVREVLSLRNFGDETIAVLPPVQLESDIFSVASDCDTVTLAPQEMSTCSIVLTYHPIEPGEHFDTLLIPTNADNGDANNFFRIPLYGQLVTSAGEEPSLLPKVFALRPAYPNPFNATTRIAYDLPKSSRVSLSVFNLQGQKVATLVDGFQAAGAYSIAFDGSALASGVYLYRLQTEGFVQTRKMVLLK
ncbi:MAG: T9SS type A sorting domain-containing protein [Calditrichota bacterium]